MADQSGTLDWSGTSAGTRQTGCDLIIAAGDPELRKATQARGARGGGEKGTRRFAERLILEGVDASISRL
jgi:hypothetical protein